MNGEFSYDEELRRQQLEFLGLTRLDTRDADTLVSTPMKSTPFVVSELIPQGLHIIGGASKIGKSWLMLWLGLRVSRGEPIWNYETTQGTVLYLALEDSFERLQRRLLDINDVQASEKLQLADCKSHKNEKVCFH